jgi:hypothetical protein
MLLGTASLERSGFLDPQILLARLLSSSSALAEGRRGPQRGISQPQQKLPAVVWGSPGKTASGRDLRLVVSDSGAVRKDVKAYFFTLKLREVIREVP